MDWKEVFVVILVFLILGIIICYTAFAGNKQAREIAKVLIIILVVLLICFLIYEIYMYYKKVHINEPLLIQDSIDAGTNSKSFHAKQLPPSDLGTEFSYSFWIYVDEWDTKFNEFKHILSRSQKAPSGPTSNDEDPNFTACPGIWMYPKSSNLMIRFDTYNRPDSFAYYPFYGSNEIENNAYKQISDLPVSDAQQLCKNDEKCAGFQMDRVTSKCSLLDDASQLPPTTTDHTDAYLATNKKTGKPMLCRDDQDCNYPASQYCDSAHDKRCKTRYDSYRKTSSMNPNVSSSQIIDASSQCDVVQLPIQRWVHVAVTLWNRTADVYINGKLNRSCILENVPKINYKHNLYVLQNGGFNGKLAQLRYYNRALNATEVYSQYSKGPLHWSIFKAFEDLFPKTHTDINVSGSASYKD